MCVALWVEFMLLDHIKSACYGPVEIRLESYGPRLASFILCYNLVCVYCKPIHTSLFRILLRLTTKLTSLMTAYYTPNYSISAKGVSFYNNEVDYLHYSLQYFSY